MTTSEYGSFRSYCHRRAPSLAATPAILSLVTWMYCRTPPISATIGEEYVARSVKPLLRQMTSPVFLLSAASVPAVDFFGKHRTDLRGPQLLDVVRLGIGDVEGEDVLDVTARAQQIQAVSDDGRTGVADAGLFVSPDQRRSICGPALEKAGF